MERTTVTIERTAKQASIYSNDPDIVVMREVETADSELIEFYRAAFVAATGKSIAGFDLHQLEDDPRMRGS